MEKDYVTSNLTDIKGLTTEEVIKLRNKFGKNELVPESKNSFVKKFLRIITQPMFLLLILSATIYFILGEPTDGLIMLVFVVGIISIDVIQVWKTDNTLNALKNLSTPHIKVTRDGIVQDILSSDLVPGDVMIISEGSKIPADGYVISTNNLLIDESTLTGESVGVWKVVENSLKSNKEYWKNDYCYAGTFVLEGIGHIRVDKIGLSTEYGKISKNIASAPENLTPLQKQMNKLVLVCAFIAAFLFITISIFTFITLSDKSFTERLIASILSGITIAMAMIPEEFPVILTVFLALGAWRLAKKHSLIRKLASIETLGAVSVLCVDKTGTITMNKMTVQNTWSSGVDNKYLSKIMGLACQEETYDSMEKAMLNYSTKLGITREELFKGKLIKEYAFSNEIKMMGRVWNINDQTIIAVKGSPENILNICKGLNKEVIEKKVSEMAKDGLRVIGVGEMKISKENEIPEKLVDCKLDFLGLIALYDPPKEFVKEDIATCTKAGIRVVMITGDNGITASSIASMVGIPNSDKIITSDELNLMGEDELRKSIKEVSIFSRVIPEQKMRIIKAFKANGDIVAMTGDGVNDAPALKYADIGIAMGKRGSEVSREASDLILMDDNFTTIVKTVKDGRRIYDNIRKSIGYVITIHIPIALTALLSPLFNIFPASLLLLPVHIVLLELIIDPTCSIILEREPAEKDIMERKPRNPKEKILTPNILIKSLAQGLVIFINSFTAYYLVLSNDPNNGPVARSIGLTIVIISNLFLVLVNISNNDFVIKSMIRLIKDKVMWSVIIGTIIMIYIILYTPISVFFKLAPLNLEQLLTVILIAGISVFWYEIVKLTRYIRKRGHN